MDKLMQMMEKKKGKPLDPTYKEAKMSMLGELVKAMSGGMAEKMKGMKKVTVAAPDQEGLKTGLEKAEELIAGGSEDSKEEAEEPEAEMESEMPEMSPEEIDAKIAELEAMKSKMSSK